MSAPKPPTDTSNIDGGKGGARIDGTDSAIAARATGTTWRDSVLRYYSLAKPGVLFGNVLTAAAGFLFASPGQIDWPLFMAVVAGTTLVIASACVLNNVLDRDIDTVMERTKKRATVTGGVQARNAVIYSALLGAGGMAVLVAWTVRASAGAAAPSTSEPTAPATMTAMRGVVRLMRGLLRVAVADRRCRRQPNLDPRARSREDLPARAPLRFSGIQQTVSLLPA